MNQGAILLLIGMLGFWAFNEFYVMPNHIKREWSSLDFINYSGPKYMGLIYVGGSFFFLVLFLKGSVMLIRDYEREGATTTLKCGSKTPKKRGFQIGKSR